MGFGVQTPPAARSDIQPDGTVMYLQTPAEPLCRGPLLYDQAWVTYYVMKHVITAIVDPPIIQRVELKVLACRKKLGRLVYSEFIMDSCRVILQHAFRPAAVVQCIQGKLVCWP